MFSSTTTLMHRSREFVRKSKNFYGLLYPRSALCTISKVVPTQPDGLDRIPHISSTRGILRGLDWAGTAVFAASGAIAAAEANFDLLGAVAVGTVTAVGGGTLRDLVIFARAPFWSTAAADGGEPEVSFALLMN